MRTVTHLKCTGLHHHLAAVPPRARHLLPRPQGGERADDGRDGRRQAGLLLILSVQLLILSVQLLILSVQVDGKPGWPVLCDFGLANWAKHGEAGEHY